jgi:hypothetical protein
MLPRWSELKVVKCEVVEAREVSGKTGKFVIRAHQQTGFYSANGEVGTISTDLPDGSTKQTTKPAYSPGQIVELVDAYSITNDSGVWSVRSGVLEERKGKQ